MSPRAKTIRDGAVNAAIGVIATIFLTSAFHFWETAADHKADIVAVNSRLERILDVLCERERVRACDAAGGDVIVRASRP